MERYFGTDFNQTLFDLRFPFETDGTPRELRFEISIQDFLHAARVLYSANEVGEDDGNESDGDMTEEELNEAMLEAIRTGNTEQMEILAVEIDAWDREHAYMQGRLEEYALDLLGEHEYEEGEEEAVDREEVFSEIVRLILRQILDSVVETEDENVVMYVR
jgi:hypothetical protein